MPQTEQRQHTSAMPPTSTEAGLAPVLADAEKIREELGLIDPETGQVLDEIDPALQEAANEWAAQLLDVSTEDFQGRQDRTNAVESMGSGVSRNATRINQMLEQPIRKLQQLGEEGSSIGDNLVNLKVEFDAIDPFKVNFNPGWLGRWFSWVPYFGKSLNRYFTKFESSGAVIDSLFGSLEASKQELIRDNNVLREEQTFMRSTTLGLQQTILTGRLVDKQLQARLDSLPQDSDQAKFIAEELLFPLRQRITDLQQQLVVLQQGILTFEVLVRNNKELIRGVERSWTVTYPALRIGITLAVALVNQKIVIGKLKALDEMGANVILQTSELLRTQGTDIHKQAAGARLDDDKLKAAMTNAVAALDEVAAFRRKAIEEMSQQIDERDRLAKLGEEAIQRMERGNAAQPSISLELDSVAA